MINSLDKIDIGNVPYHSTIAEALILILLLTVITVLFMKFIIWYMHHII